MQKTVRTCGVRLKNRQERNAELRDAAFAIVAGVENYSTAKRNSRAADVEAVFPPVGAASAKSAGKATAAKSTAKAAVIKKPVGSAAKTSSKTSAMKTPTAKSTAKAGTKAAAAKGSAMRSAAKTTARSAAGSTAKSAAGRTSKGPTPAGMSVGPHDGDVC